MTATIIASATAVWLFLILVAVGLAQAAAHGDVVMRTALAQQVARDTHSRRQAA
jgi:hypothetical protein